MIEFAKDFREGRAEKDSGLLECHMNKTIHTLTTVAMKIDVELSMRGAGS